METLWAMGFVIIFISSLILNIWQWLVIRELHYNIEIQKNSLRLWLDSEVYKKRTFSKLSEALQEDRDYFRNQFYNYRKKYIKIKKLLSSYNKGRITVDILLSKIK